MPRRKPADFRPGPDDFNHEELLLSMRLTRELLVKYASACGSKTIQKMAANVLLGNIDDFSKVVNYPNAEKIVHDVDFPTTPKG